MGETQPSKRLESWKEIAAYLGKDKKTAQRWERDRGLPVHRLPGNRSNVFAYTHELDAWMSGQQIESEPQGSAGRHLESSTTSEIARRRAKVLAVPVVLVLVATAYLTLRRPIGNSTVPTRVAYGASSLTAYGPKDEILWTHEFPGPLLQLVPEPARNPSNEDARFRW